jgi:hypothetical protein
MPFMAFTNLLRGIDLPTVAFILVYLFFVICVAIQVAIFLACLPISRPLQILVGLVGVSAMAPTVGGLTFGFFSLMQSGVGSMMMGGRFWSTFAITAVLVLAAGVLLYLLSVALISPPSANRALPIRGYLTGLWIAGGLMTAESIFRFRDTALIGIWCILTLIIMAFSLMVVISNHDQLSLRVRRRIPEPLYRCVVFPFTMALPVVWFGSSSSRPQRSRSLTWRYGCCPN